MKRTVDSGAPAIMDWNLGKRVYLAPDGDGGGTPTGSGDSSKLAAMIEANSKAVAELGETVKTLGAGNSNGSRGIDAYDLQKAIDKREAAKSEAAELRKQVEQLTADLEAAKQGTTAAVERVHKAGKFKEALKNAGITDPDKVLKLSDFGDEQVDALKVTEDGSFEGFKETVEKYSAAYPEYFKAPEGAEAKRAQPQTPPAIDVTNSGKDFDPLSGANMEAVHNAAVEKLLKGK